MFRDQGSKNITLEKGSTQKDIHSSKVEKLNNHKVLSETNDFYRENFVLDMTLHVLPYLNFPNSIWVIEKSNISKS